MEKSKILLIFFGVKLLILSLCIVLMQVQQVIGAIWFNPTVTTQEVKEALKKNKKNIDERGPDGGTGLMYAVAHSSLETVKVFLSAGANVNVSKNDPMRDSILHIACYNGDFTDGPAIIDLLLKHGADVHAKSATGSPPLHYLMEIDSIDTRKKIIASFVALGADINAQDKTGNTIVHIAMNNKDKYTIQMFLDSFGSIINLNLKNKDGFTPREMAVNFGFTDIIKIIDDFVTLRTKNELKGQNKKQKSG